MSVAVCARDQIFMIGAHCHDTDTYSSVLTLLRVCLAATGPIGNRYVVLGQVDIEHK